MLSPVIKCPFCGRECRGKRGLSKHANKTHSSRFIGKVCRANASGGLKAYLPADLCRYLGLEHGDLLLIVSIGESYVVLRKLPVEDSKD